MAYIPNVWVDDDGSGTLGTRITKSRLDHMEQGVVDATPALVTALPPAPADGDEVYYLADTTPSYGGPYLWHLRYRAAAAGVSRWESVAALPELRAYEQWQVTTAQNAQQDLGGPYLTVPLAGDYDIYYGATVQHANTTDAAGLVSLVKNASNELIEEGIRPTSPVGSANYGWTGPLTARARITLAAGDQVKLMYRSLTGVTCGWDRRELRIRPIRVG